MFYFIQYIFCFTYILHTIIYNLYVCIYQIHVYMYKNFGVILFKLTFFMGSHRGETDVCVDSPVPYPPRDPLDRVKWKVRNSGREGPTSLCCDNTRDPGTGTGCGTETGREGTRGRTGRRRHPDLGVAAEVLRSGGTSGSSRDSCA